MPSTVRRNRCPPKKVRTPDRSTLKEGDRVEMISGTLAGITGEVIRLEKRGIYLIGVPAAHSGLLIRVPVQRFKLLCTVAE